MTRLLDAIGYYDYNVDSTYMSMVAIIVMSRGTNQPVWIYYFNE